jgi:hypothetical protein
MSSNLFSDLEIAAEVVERQLDKWNAMQRAARETNKKMPTPAFRFITIARDKGSLGDEVAQELSRRLGWHVFDKEIVTYIAKDNRVRENLVRQLEENSENIVQDTISRFLGKPEDGYIANWEYHESLLKTLAYIAKKGQAIILGRGANFVLREDKEGMNVLITASPEIRVRRISESLHMTPEAARHHMTDDDEERRRFMRQYYRQDFENMDSYDVVFNTDRASPERIASSILSLMNLSAG